MHRASTVVVAVYVLCLASAVAHAQQECASLGGNIIYGVGGSAQTPLIGQIASRLRDPQDHAARLTVVYAQPGLCSGFIAFDGERTEAERYLTSLPTGANAYYWNQGNGSPQPCTLGTEVLADFAVAPLGPSACPEVGALLPEIEAFDGPVSTFNIIVPTDSTQRSISAEALYALFKFGDAAQIAPWTDERYIVLHGGTSVVQLGIAQAVGYSGDFEHGYVYAGAATPLATVAASGVHGASAGVEALTVPNTDATLGFESGENYEQNRQSVRTLAYQHVEQSCAYWPDSTESASDKLNVRIGRYALWSALRFYAAVGEDDEVVDPDVAKLIGFATGALEPPPELPIIDVYIDNYGVPQCAMQVSRDEPLGALSSFQPEAPCGCHFEKRATGESSCSECSDDDECPADAPVCRLGFCEVQ